jgi:predicted ester cyclase
LTIKVKKDAMMYPNFKFSCEALVSDRQVCTARLTMAFQETPGAGGLDFMGFFLKGGGS